jgi:hypothetical protein
VSNYVLFNGKFPCHTCKTEVLSLRCYPHLQKLTWMCKDKHLSEVSLKTKTKKDYEREKRK